MEAPIINPLQVVRGLMVEDKQRTPHILLRLTKENILNTCANEANEKRFLQWLRQDVFSCLKEPIKEKFATVESIIREVEKPPLGIMPEWLWKEKRIAELRQAMKRRVDVDNHEARTGLRFIEYIVSCFNDETLMIWIKEYSKLLSEMGTMNDGG